MATRKSRGPRLASVPRASGMVVRAAHARALHAGIDVDRLLAQANLTARQIDDRGASLVARDQVRFLDIVAEALGDDLFGFHLARGLELRDAGLLYYVMASAPTLLEALQRAARYWSLSNEGVVLHCATGRHLDLAVRYVGSSRHLDRHHTEGLAAVIVRVLREITGRPLSPVRVRFVHPRSKPPAELTRFFGGKVEFGARADDIRLAASASDTPVVVADAHLNRLLAGYCEEALAHRRPARGSFRARVENAIVPLLPHGEARASHVGRQLGLSERTFARRLATENITFSALLESLKVDLAHRYLADADMSISQVAWLLGYREVSAFSKAFKRWTGKSPRESRNRAAVGNA
jgi:AraC-like DNA-binding protein